MTWLILLGWLLLTVPFGLWWGWHHTDRLEDPLTFWLSAVVFAVVVVVPVILILRKEVA
jgi:hypothetical protein